MFAYLISVPAIILSTHANKHDDDLPSTINTFILNWHKLACNLLQIYPETMMDTVFKESFYNETPYSLPPYLLFFNQCPH